MVVWLHAGILFSCDKEGNPANCDNLDETLELYAKWNKSQREREIKYDVTNMWYLEKPNS